MRFIVAAVGAILALGVWALAPSDEFLAPRELPVGPQVPGQMVSLHQPPSGITTVAL